MTTDRSRLLDHARQAVADAQEVFLGAGHSDLTAKGERDFATESDFAIERMIRSHFEQRTPDIGFHGEEEGQTGHQDRQWCLDPIDGTINYSRESPLCGISLALLEDGEPTIGILAFPWLGITYEAIIGGGASRNGQAIRASSASRVSEAVVGLGDYAVGHDAESKNRQRFDLTERLAAKVLRIRMHGSAALDLAWLADGRLDASICLSNNPWDVTAGVLIAREAGAAVTDLDGTPHTSRSITTIGSIASSSPLSIGSCMPV